MLTKAYYVLKDPEKRCTYDEEGEAEPEEFPSYDNGMKHYQNIKMCEENRPASWSSGNVFVSKAGHLRFKSRTGQIRRGVANGSPFLLQFFVRNCVDYWRNGAEMGPANSLHASASYS